MSPYRLDHKTPAKKVVINWLITWLTDRPPRIFTAFKREKAIAERKSPLILPFSSAKFVKTTPLYINSSLTPTIKAPARGKKNERLNSNFLLIVKMTMAITGTKISKKVPNLALWLLISFLYFLKEIVVKGKSKIKNARSH